MQKTQKAAVSWDALVEKGRERLAADEKARAEYQAKRKVEARDAVEWLTLAERGFYRLVVSHNPLTDEYGRVTLQAVSGRPGKAPALPDLQSVAALVAFLTDEAPAVFAKVLKG